MKLVKLFYGKFLEFLLLEIPGLMLCDIGVCPFPSGDVSTALLFLLIIFSALERDTVSFKCLIIL